MKNPYLHYQNNSRYWIRSTKQKSKKGVVGVESLPYVSLDKEGVAGVESLPYVSLDKEGVVGETLVSLQVSLPL